jgi:hypothetical protein
MHDPEFLPRCERVHYALIWNHQHATPQYLRATDLDLRLEKPWEDRPSVTWELNAISDGVIQEVRARIRKQCTTTLTSTLLHIVRSNTNMSGTQIETCPVGHHKIQNIHNGKVASGTVKAGGQDKKAPGTYIKWDAPGVETMQPEEKELIQQVSDQFNRFQMMNFNEHMHCLRGTHLKTQGVRT